MNTYFENCHIVIDAINKYRDIVSATVALLRKHLSNPITVIIDNDQDIDGANVVFRDPNDDKFALKNVFRYVSSNIKCDKILLWDYDVFVSNVDQHLIRIYWDAFVKDERIGNLRLTTTPERNVRKYAGNNNLVVCKKSNRWYFSMWPCFIRLNFLKEVSRYTPKDPWQMEIDAGQLARKSNKISVKPLVACYEGVNFIKRGGVTLSGLKVAKENNLSFPGLKMWDKTIYRATRLIRLRKRKSAWKLLLSKKAYKKPDRIKMLRLIGRLISIKRDKSAIRVMRSRLARLPEW